MQIKYFFSLFIISAISFSSTAQLPDTDIFISEIKKVENKWTFGVASNIINRKGYDNHPSFSPDGKKILYVAFKDTIQSDVYEYNLSSKKIDQITFTAESEYSPVMTPDGKNISIVRVDKDSAQRFYIAPLSDIQHPEFIKGTDSIGYYCRLSDTLLAMFILGPANTLQVLNTKTAERTLTASDIGRCLKLSSDQKLLYFLIKGNEKEWFIYSMRIADFKLERVIQTLPACEDFALLPDNTILLGSEGKLYSYNSSQGNDWNQVADFTETLPAFYRIAVDKTGTYLALVAYSGKKP